MSIPPPHVFRRQVFARCEERRKALIDIPELARILGAAMEVRVSFDIVRVLTRDGREADRAEAIQALKQTLTGYNVEPEADLVVVTAPYSQSDDYPLP